MNNNVVFQEKYELRNKVKYHVHLHNRGGKIGEGSRLRMRGSRLFSFSLSFHAAQKPRQEHRHGKHGRRLLISPQSMLHRNISRYTRNTQAFKDSAAFC